MGRARDKQRRADRKKAVKALKARKAPTITKTDKPRRVLSDFTPWYVVGLPAADNLGEP